MQQAENVDGSSATVTPFTSADRKFLRRLAAEQDSFALKRGILPA